jgi:hypothetical protein
MNMHKNARLTPRGRERVAVLVDALAGHKRALSNVPGLKVVPEYYAFLVYYDGVQPYSAKC